MSQEVTPVQRDAARLAVRMDRDRGRRPSALLLAVAAGRREVPEPKREPSADD